MMAPTAYNTIFTHRAFALGPAEVEEDSMEVNSNTGDA